MTFVYVFLPYTVQDGRTVRYLGLYVSMDSLTLTLASFSQRYLAEAQDDINVLLLYLYKCFGLHLYWGWMLRDILLCFVWIQEM